MVVVRRGGVPPPPVLVASILMMLTAVTGGMDIHVVSKTHKMTSVDIKRLWRSSPPN
jgi:hypothetical protein